MGESQTCVVWSTAPDEESAREIARALVGEGLAACVNLLPILGSVFRWEGQIEEQSEISLMIKTEKQRLAELEARLCALHPYSVPELLVVPVTAGLPAYLDWVAKETSQ